MQKFDKNYDMKQSTMIDRPMQFELQKFDNKIEIIQNDCSTNATHDVAHFQKQLQITKHSETKRGHV